MKSHSIRSGSAEPFPGSKTTAIFTQDSCTSCGRWRTAWLVQALALIVMAGSAMADSYGRLELKTEAFPQGGTIPKHYTCEGADASPALSWSQPPASTRSFVLMVDDPDTPAGDWVHWVAYNLPASARHLPESVPPGQTIASGGEQGLNDFPSMGYRGPCPPPGRPHRYFFRLYALDTVLNLHGPARRKNVDSVMKGHVLAKAELMGTFGR